MPSYLDLVRHGAAESQAEGGDATRHLTSAGRSAAEALGRRLAGESARPDRIYSSPLARARETALLLAAALGRPRIEVLAELEPEAEPADLWRALGALGGTRGHVLLVSHLPLVARLAGQALGHEGPPFSPCQLVRIEFEGDVGPGRGIERWCLPPRSP